VGFCVLYRNCFQYSATLIFAWLLFKEINLILSEKLNAFGKGKGVSQTQNES